MWGRVIRTTIVWLYLLAFSVTLWVAFVGSILVGHPWFPIQSREAWTVAILFTVEFFISAWAIHDEED